MWRMIGLGDRAKDSRRGQRRDVGRITKVEERHVVITYEDGEEKTVPIGHASKKK